MKLLPLALVGIGAAAGFWSGPQPPDVLILTGDIDGNIAPCGCTKPMTGGIKRRIQAAKSLAVPGRTTLLDNGNLVAGTSRQDQIKAQAIAEILGSAGWDAINLGPADAKLGLGMVLSLNSLSGGKFIASQLGPGKDLRDFAVHPPFFVMGVAANSDALAKSLGEQITAKEKVIAEGIVQAKEAGLAPILLLQGSEDDARKIASQFPALALIQYRSVGNPSQRPTRIGNTLLVAPGSDGKYVLRLEYSKGNFRNYSAVALSPAFKDDATASRMYRTYLSRVSSEHLLEDLPRPLKDSYAGTATCGTCHSKALAVWKTSLHSHALETLERRAHDRDPECLPCHVVGLQSVHGFTSRSATPQLANVGCESCHGAGLDHAKNPILVKLAKVGSTPCGKCHTGNTSPGFDFSTYWKKIKH
ncbi:MAG: hypothetical protein QOJ65_490 [Fimbriimonadaceae bacterium]|jgi:hypothetical protein|nr:hypothetical protein [Fimbriimonadaceae bacterium]